MKSVKVRIEGISPLIMHAPKGLDESNADRVEQKQLTSKGAKKRTESDAERLVWLDWILAIHHNGQFVYVPEECIVAAIRDGAKRSRRGKEITAAVMISPQEVPLIYDGPKDPQQLFASAGHRDLRPVVVNRQRIMKCRPRFNVWALEFEILYDEQTINSKSIRKALEDGGQYCGMLDFRPRFGRYEVKSWKE